MRSWRRKRRRGARNAFRSFFFFSERGEIELREEKKEVKGMFHLGCYSYKYIDSIHIDTLAPNINSDRGKIGGKEGKKRKKER